MPMRRVAVLDDWQGVAERLADWSPVRALADLAIFRVPLRGEALVNELADCEAIVLMRERTPFPASVIERLPELRHITFTGTRNASLDIDACTAQGIVVSATGSPGPSHSTAELALALLLAAARRLPRAFASVRVGGFQEHVPLGMGLAGRTLGIIGLGNIGARVARYGQALDMEVLAWSQNLTDERAKEVGVTRVGKNELLARSDAVSLHLVLSDRTRGVLGTKDLARMKPGAILVNTSRGPLVDEAALVDAVREGRIIAALDVFDTEPLPPGHELRAAPDAVLTPHLGYVVEETMAWLYQASVESLVAWMEGRPIRVMNPAVLRA
jgi:phosphoglycerate dehydrogenase-like enzyme